MAARTKQVNERAGKNSAYARTGKDGGFYTEDGALIATVDTFTSNITFNNAAYSVLGHALELEAPNTFKVALTMSQVVVESDQFLDDLFDYMKTGIMPEWSFKGSLKGVDDDHEETIIYKQCIPSGQIDLQNITTGEVVKRNWNFAVNEIPIISRRLPRIN